MRKAIIVERNITDSELRRYGDFPFLVLKSQEGIMSDQRFEDFTKKIVPNVVDPSQFNVNKVSQETHSLDDTINYLYRKGFDEITILTNYKKDMENMFISINILQKYAHLRVRFEDENESMQYFEEGTYILNKENCQTFSICPYPEAIISLDYTLEKISNYKLDKKNSILKDIKFFQRIVLLRVISGSVVVIRKLGEKNED